MNNSPILIPIVAVLLPLIDAIYLFLIADHMKNQYLKIQHSPMKIRWIGAVVCYILLAIGLYWFVLREGKSVTHAFLLGIIIYGVYDSVNYTLLTHYSPILAIIDTIWGGAIMAIVTLIIYSFNKYIK